MEFVVSSIELYEHLQLVSKVVVPKNSMPILDNLLFKIEDGNLVITGSDLETTVSSTLPLDSCSGSLLMAIEAKKILDILKEFPEQPLTFNVDEETLNVTMRTVNGEFSLVGISGEDFPTIPTLKEDKVSLTTTTDLLQSGISGSIFATGQDELRPLMNGIFIEFPEEGGINFVATDAHELALYRRKEVNIGVKNSFILPKKPANILKNILPKASIDLVIEFDDKNTIFSFGTLTLICRLIEGQYPNYSAVIPTDNPYKAVVDKEALIRALRRVSLFSSQASHLVGLSFENDKITITAKDLDYSTSGEETIPCRFDGDPFTIGFKSDSLIELLSNIGSDDVLVELSDPNRACLILPQDNDMENEEITMLLMPMMI